MKYDEPKLNVLIDHIGMFERSAPAQRWRAISILMLTLLVFAVGIWEWKMRSLGLRTSDLDDSSAHWAVERRKVDAGPRDQVVVVGDSRILFDTNLALWQEISGVRPIQLALAGTPAAPYLHDIAADEHFAGLVVLGIAEGSFFSDLSPLFNALAYVRTESPSQRVSHHILLLLSRQFAFLDRSYALFALVNSADVPNRAGVGFSGWLASNATKKLGEAFENRQTVMWPRVAADPSEWRASWKTAFSFFPVQQLPDGVINQVIANTQRDIEKIRARGGEVVIVRPPSSGLYRDLEKVMTPRDKVWDSLVKETKTLGIYFEDYPEMQNLNLPEWSHLSGEDAKKFTRAYVTVLCKQVPWLKQHGGKCAAAEQDVSRL